MYDYAEGILLGVLLRDLLPHSIDVSKKMTDRLIVNYQTKYGYFITKVMIFGVKNKVPYLRWPQSQLFFAITSFLKSKKEDH